MSSSVTVNATVWRPAAGAGQLTVEPLSARPVGPSASAMTSGASAAPAGSETCATNAYAVPIRPIVDGVLSNDGATLLIVICGVAIVQSARVAFSQPRIRTVGVAGPSNAARLVAAVFASSNAPSLSRSHSNTAQPSHVPTRLIVPPSLMTYGPPALTTRSTVKVICCSVKLPSESVTRKLNCTVPPAAGVHVTRPLALTAMPLG